MRTLYHHQMSPFCRKVRIALVEKGLDYTLEDVRPWERNETFLRLDPAGEVPVLVEDDGHVISDHTAICEYLDESEPRPSLFGVDPRTRAEVRRLLGWFDRKFNREVVRNLVGEKLIKRIRNDGAPDSRAIRAGKANIRTHMRYIEWLIERRRFLGGEYLSFADLSAASHLSVIDYIGDVPWEDFPDTKDWYARIKSRPSFRPLLSDVLPGIHPPAHYADLDF